jgi:hypothetical protein
MERVSFSSALQTLAELDKWLASLGIATKRDRWRAAVEMVSKAKAQREHIEGGGRLVPIRNYVPALFEALEILLVKRAFSDDESPALKEKLSRALGGPDSPSMEGSKNSGPRNTMFELALAADWKTAGADVELGEPDIKVRFGGASFVVECKRPFSAHSVRANIHDAASQLGALLDSPEHAGSFGVVAVSLNRVFNPDTCLWFAPEGKGSETIDKALIELIETHKHQWKWDAKRLHQRIAAVMFSLAVPWDIGGERLIYLSTRKFFGQAKCQAGFRILQEGVSMLYAA